MSNSQKVKIPTKGPLESKTNKKQNFYLLILRYKY
uniref:Uncharacterized protein n=1 Tax=Nelumbo nucifera TaxID=4432 RepID=A0A822YZB7_NELNU|nr:TPA_asm: hypothetical protein HUJ06_008224 [Nelumbo nucifera]